MSNVSLSHEAPLEVLRQTPSAVLDLMRVAGLDASTELGVELLDTELVDARPSVRRADLVARLRSARGSPESLVVVEVQRGRDDEKPAVWLEYVAFLHRKYRLPTTLIVLTFDRHVARWARRPRRIGAGVLFRPSVIGPDELPPIASIEDALAHPERAMVAALAYLGARDVDEVRAHEEEIVRVFEAVMRGDEAPKKQVYLSLLHGLATNELRSRLEKLMEVYGMGALDMIRAEGRLEGEAEGRLAGEAEGRRAGKAEALLAVLRAKGFTLEARYEALVLGSKDLGRLDRWLTRAVVASTTDEVFDERES